jgi:hypothetical protein
MSITGEKYLLRRGKSALLAQLGDQQVLKAG